MKKALALMLEELHRVENDLAAELLRLSDRHRVEHDIHHVARDLARWSQQHVRLIAEAGREHGLALSPDADDDVGLVARLRDRGSVLVGRSEPAALVLIADLRALYRTIGGVSIDWETLSLGAQGAREKALQELASACHPQTLRQLRWSNAMIKERAPQAMASR